MLPLELQSVLNILGLLHFHGCFSIKSLRFMPERAILKIELRGLIGLQLI